MGLGLALFGLGPRRPIRASAPLRLRLAPISGVVPMQVQWAAEKLAEAWDDYWFLSHPRPKFVPPRGFTYIGGGETRAAYRYGNFVIKIAWNTADYDQNRTEAEAWRQAPAELRRYLVPVLAVDVNFPGPRWIIMPYATGSVSVLEAENLCRRLSQRFPEVFYDCENPLNWRMYQGHARLIDYPEDLGQNTRLYAHGRKG